MVGHGDSESLGIDGMLVTSSNWMARREDPQQEVVEPM